MVCQFILEERNLIDSSVSTSEHVNLVNGPRAASDARDFMRDRLKAVTSPDRLYDVLLLTSELVTNGVLHARTDLHLGVTWDYANILVTVQDHSPPPGAESARAAVTELEESGRGMSVIATLADDFGWRLLPDRVGKVMWFTLVIAGAAKHSKTSV